MSSASLKCPQVVERNHRTGGRADAPLPMMTLQPHLTAAGNSLAMPSPLLTDPVLASTAAPALGQVFARVTTVSRTRPGRDAGRRRIPGLVRSCDNATSGACEVRAATSPPRSVGSGLYAPPRGPDQGRARERWPRAVPVPLASTTECRQQQPDAAERRWDSRQCFGPGPMPTGVAASSPSTTSGVCDPKGLALRSDSRRTTVDRGRGWLLGAGFEIG